jgi:hypothetical protein
VKYVGDLQLQIWNREKKSYEIFDPMNVLNLPLNSEVARACAAGAPWRIAKRDRPLKPVLKNHYREYGGYQGRS